MKGKIIGAAGILGIFGTAAGWIVSAKKKKDLLNYKDFRINKFQKYFDVTNEWVRLKNQGRNLEEFFLKNGWKHIAVYGMGELGHRLVEELAQSRISIEYAIDEHTDKVISEIVVKAPGDELTQVDVIVVTPFFEYPVVEDKLMELVDYPIISLEDVVFFM